MIRNLSNIHSNLGITANKYRFNFSNKPGCEEHGWSSWAPAAICEVLCVRTKKIIEYVKYLFVIGR